MKKLLQSTGGYREHLRALHELGFSRIATQIESMWGYPGLDRYFDELLINYRGQRRGFPKPVFEHILRLFILHNSPHGYFNDPWGHNLARAMR